MNAPKWAALTEKLTNHPDPKVRRKACLRLAATRDPEVILSLRKAYYEDQDERVREAARDALARFKTLAAEQSTRRFPLSDRVLNVILGVLVVIFVVSLALNIVRMLGDVSTKKQPDDQSGVFNPTDRTVLVAQIEERLGAAQTLSENLRTIIINYNQSGQVVCDPANQIPAALAFSEMDKKTYPDLAVIANKFDASLNPLTTALVLLNQACSDPNKQTVNVVEAGPKLEQTEAQLSEVASLLQMAITNPAATVGPTVTPLPTWTPTPTITNTPAPPTATLPVTATLVETSTPIHTLTPTISPTPTLTLTPRPTLPFPALDYPQILNDLSARYIVMGDIKNGYGSGMLDQWNKVKDGGAASTSLCDHLQLWPDAFALTPEQQALLDAPNVADPSLERAIQLQAEGLDFARRARELYERDCPIGALNTSMAQGIRLSEDALGRFEASMQFVEEISNRPQE